MRPALLLAAKDLRQRLRDRSLFIFGALVPFALTFIFDLLLGPVSGDVRLMFSGASSSPSVVRDLGDDNYLAMVVPLRTS